MDWLLINGQIFERDAQPTDASRYVQMQSKTPWQGLRVGVTLSGGGYRASIMHAGTLDALERLGVTYTSFRRIRRCHHRRVLFCRRKTGGHT